MTKYIISLIIFLTFPASVSAIDVNDLKNEFTQDQVDCNDQAKEELEDAVEDGDEYEVSTPMGKKTVKLNDKNLLANMGRQKFRQNEYEKCMTDNDWIDPNTYTKGKE